MMRGWRERAWPQGGHDLALLQGGDAGQGGGHRGARDAQERDALGGAEPQPPEGSTPRSN